MDNGYTPYLSVVVDSHTRVPPEYVKDGGIVLNLSPSATHGMLMDNDWIQFSARFNGVSRQLEIPIAAVAGIFARENGEGLGFEVSTAMPAENPSPVKSPISDDDNPPPTAPAGKPKLQIVK
ncbi:ClpXP protease specificity-enhancing factor SspB [Sulfuriferula sp. AH1]|uniref:ClpXP protease specificity-enhancing factor SspB n=1 Tax=Sulfuriferula sp. AH1 TaxID=1985873 RepID=UPI00350FCEA4